MKLFVVKNRNGSVAKENGKVLYFANKEDAKKVRNELNGKKDVYVVSRGPDHIGKHGDRNSTIRSRAHKNRRM